MNRQQKQDALRRVLGDPLRVSGDEYGYSCPKRDCPYYGKDSPKLVVNLATDLFRCWVCDFRGRDLSRILRLRKGNPDLQSYLEGRTLYVGPIQKHTDVPTLPPDFTPVVYGPREAKGYLTSRGVTEEQMVRYRLGTSGTSYWGRVILPSFDREGTLNYITGRAISPTNRMRYWSPRISKDVVLYEDTVDWSRPVILVEGMFDAIATGEDAVPLGGKYLGSRLLARLVEADGPVYVALDRDAMRDARNVVRTLLSYDLEVRLCPLPGKDPAALGADAMRRIVGQYIEVHDELGLMELQVRGVA